MDNRYYENVIAEMKSFLDENGFKADGDFFVSDTKKIEVKYDDARQTYSLFIADKNEDGTFGELQVVNSWLFDDSQNASDAGSVGIDFVVSLRKALGVKIQRASNTNIELPTSGKAGNSTVAGFTKKMLDIFPAIKDDYKEHIAVYGNFLYINFFGDYLVPQLKNMFTNGTKKQIKKLFNVLEDTYVKGDKETVNVMIAVLVAAGYNDEKCRASIEEMLLEDAHFLQSYKSLAVRLPKSKKLFKALVK